MDDNLRKLMRKKNRLFKEYKKDKSVESYNKFKKIKHEVTPLFRKSKKDYINSLATKPKSKNLTAKHYWKTLKSFIKPTLTSTTPPLYDNETYVFDSTEKANLFNNNFAQQTFLDDSSSVLPDSTNCSRPSLDNIVFIQQ